MATLPPAVVMQNQEEEEPELSSELNLGNEIVPTLKFTPGIWRLLEELEEILVGAPP